MQLGAIRSLIGICVVLTAGAAGAVPVTIAFAGSVTNDPFGLSTPGAPISGSYTFDTSAADGIAAASTGSYASVGPPFGFSANVDGVGYSVAGSLNVNTANDIGVDQYGVIAGDPTLTLELFLQDGSQAALSNDQLVVAPVLASFDFRQFRLFAADAEFFGSVDSLSCIAGCVGVPAPIPEPGTLGLVACLLAGIVMRAPRLRRMT